MPPKLPFPLKTRILSWFRWYNSFIVRRKEPLITDMLEKFYRNSLQDYRQSVKEADEKWQLSRYRWRFDQKDHCLYFEHKKGKLPTLVAKAQILGGHFIHTHEWHWSWSTPHVPKKTTRAARRLRSFGRRFGQPLLYTGTIDVQHRPKQGHMFSALGLALSDAKLVYQGQSDQQILYFLLWDINELGAHNP